MIKKEGNFWILYNKDGTMVLSKHKTKRQAIAQELAILIAKRKEKD
jgi:hypothetical protein